jgi:hypothetical protein
MVTPGALRCTDCGIELAGVVVKQVRCSCGGFLVASRGGAPVGGAPHAGQPEVGRAGDATNNAEQAADGPPTRQAEPARAGGR